MPWTYDPSSKIGQVRDLIGDTMPEDQQLNDTEIAACLSRYANVFFAAALAATKIAGRYARQVTMSSPGALSASLSDLFKHYTDMAVTMRAEGARSGISPFVGGISVSDKAANNEDTDAVKPYVTREQFTVPGSIPSGSGDMIEQ